MEEITASEHLVKSVINELLDPEHELSEDETFKDILEQNINNNHNEYIVGITREVQTRGHYEYIYKINLSKAIENFWSYLN